MCVYVCAGLHSIAPKTAVPPIPFDEERPVMVGSTDQPANQPIDRPIDHRQGIQPKPLPVMPVKNVTVIGHPRTPSTHYLSPVFAVGVMGRSRQTAPSAARSFRVSKKTGSLWTAMGVLVSKQDGHGHQ